MMRVMGNHLFDLKLHDVFLPNHTIERDKFDILAVVRNIPSFISNYKYNILSQRFLEVSGENKIINCISIQQLSDSIRTHGLGILSTTVNAFYRYMAPYPSFYLEKLLISASFCSWTIFKTFWTGIESGSNNIAKRRTIMDFTLMKGLKLFIIRLKN